jgi:hypothetical protein
MHDADPHADPQPDSQDPTRPRRERKQHVLHTRISQQLAEDIGRMADDLRVPVSNLVRNVLEEVFSVVETVTDNVGELLEDVMEEAERARERHPRFHRHARRHGWRREPRGEAAADAARPREAAARTEPPDVVGWQALILAREAVCADCAAPLARGERAYLGVGATGTGSHTLCADCLDARRRT